VVPLAVALATPEFDAVAKPFCRHQTDDGALALDEDIRGDGRAVHEKGRILQQIRHRRRKPLRRPFKRIHHAGSRIGGHGQGLEHVHVAGRIAGHEIGKGSADIDTDAPD
jgi:hypothetical protein